MAKTFRPEDFTPNEGIKQNSIEDILMEDEEILTTLVPNKKVFILEALLKGLPFVLLWAAFDVFFIVNIINSPATKESGFPIAPILIVFFLLHLMPVWLYVGRVVKRVAGYKNIQYVFTDKRVITRSGIIGIDFKFIYFTDIQALDVKVGILDRLFKVGDLVIRSASQTMILDDIAYPYQYSAKLQKVVTDIKADMAYPNDLRPGENHGYQTKYKGDDK